MATITYFPTVANSQDGATVALIGSTVAPFMAARSATLTKMSWYATGSDLFGKLDSGTIANTGDAYMVQAADGTWKTRVETGTTASSAKLVRVRNASQPPGTVSFATQVSNCRTSIWGVWIRCIVTAVNATCGMSIANITDEATAETMVGVIGATSTTNFVSKIGSAAAQDTGVAIGTLGTAVHDIYWICDGTNVKSYFDGSTTAATTGASNTGANAAGHWQTNPANGGTASNAGFELIAVAVFKA